MVVIQQRGLVEMIQVIVAGEERGVIDFHDIERMTGLLSLSLIQDSNRLYTALSPHSTSVLWRNPGAEAGLPRIGSSTPAGAPCFFGATMRPKVLPRTGNR